MLWPQPTTEAHKRMHLASRWTPRKEAVSTREKFTRRKRNPRRLPYGETAFMAWDLACPTCRSLLTSVDQSTKSCPRCACEYRCEGRIWRLLTRGREEAFREFVLQYETVRAAEGRHVREVSRLRALPFRDLSHKRTYEWRVRARSFRALIGQVVRPL